MSGQRPINIPLRGVHFKRGNQALPRLRPLLILLTKRQPQHRSDVNQCADSQPKRRRHPGEMIGADLDVLGIQLQRHEKWSQMAVAAGAQIDPYALPMHAACLW